MRIFRVLKDTATGFIEDDCPRMAAALAYYTVFSLPPLLVIVISIAGFVFDPSDVQGEVNQQITNLFGAVRAEQVEGILRRADKPNTGRFGGLLGGLVLLIGATGVLNELQRALNQAWNVEPDPGQGGLRNFIFKRLISFAMVLGVAFLLMVSLVINGILSSVGNRIATLLPGGVSQTFLHSAHLAVSLGVITLLFALMYKFLPDAKIRWRDVWLGAVVTALLFVLGKFALGWYLSTRDLGSAYGAAGSLVVILLWIYYAAMTFYFGAEFTQTLKKQRGNQVRPEAGAARVVQRTEHVDAAALEDQ